MAPTLAMGAAVAAVGVSLSAATAKRTIEVNVKRRCFIWKKAHSRLPPLELDYELPGKVSTIAMPPPAGTRYRSVYSGW